MIKIALAGNPNSGKTTMFNDLTGSSQRVGNWPGVTVEKKEGKLKGHQDVVIQDLPGIYSLSPYTLEEVVTREYLIKEKPDVIINIVDASNIERNLYLTTQLTELGIPVVLALNMIDIVKKNGDVIDTKKLGEALGCTVVETSAVKRQGSLAAAQKAMEVAGKKISPVSKEHFDGHVEGALAEIETLIKDKVAADNLRWYAVKLFERDEMIIAELALSAADTAKLDKLITAIEEKEDDDAEGLITDQRYSFIAKVVGATVKKNNTNELSTSDKIDRIVTNRWLAIPIFALVMWGVYFISISTIGDMGTAWVNDVLFGEIVPEAVGGFLESLNVADWLQGLILDGIIGGVGAVLGFLPQMFVLFICLSILEDCGYMSRIAFIMDRLFRKFGLSGKSFIPMMISTGCGVPGIMATRTIENDNDRRMTAMTTTFMPCGAKLPIIALIAGALFGGAAWVATSAYFLGIAAIVVSGIILKKTKRFAGDPSPFVMELPAYHAPIVGNVLRTALQRTWAFVKKAGTIVLLSTVIIWFLSSFSLSLEMVDAEDSILAAIGNLVAPLFAPLGFGNWRATVATVTGLIAKENVVGTFGILYGGLEEVAEDGVEVWAALQAAYTPLAAYSFLVFNLLCAPCFAAIGALHREMGDPKWTLFAVGYQTGFAYVIALIVYQFGMLFTGGGFGIGTIAAIIALVGLLYFLLRKPKYTDIKGQHAVSVLSNK